MVGSVTMRMRTLLSRVPLYHRPKRMYIRHKLIQVQLYRPIFYAAKLKPAFSVTAEGALLSNYLVNTQCIQVPDYFEQPRKV